MRVLGVIPARGGSKRIPRKNCRLLHGCPLIGYTIRAAQAASLLTDWVVSTENKEIADIALSYGAYVIKRPDELAQDDSSTGSVLRHALDWMEENNGPYDMVVCLHPTSPIRDPRHIDQAIQILAKSPLPTLASVSCLPSKAHPTIFRRFVDAKNDVWDGIEPIEANAALNASIYAMKRDWLVTIGEHVNRWGPSERIVMDRRHSLDVDTEEDFRIAELYLNDHNRCSRQ